MTTEEVPVVEDAGKRVDDVILATAGYDHSLRIWQACSGVCLRTLQHPDSQVNALEIMPEHNWIAAASFQHIRMYDLLSSNANPVINFEGVSKNVTAVGFQEDGKWMFTGGEDGTAKIWDLRTCNIQCQKVYECSAPVNCAVLHPNQGELYVGDQTGAIHIWDLRTNQNDQLIPEPDASIQSVDVDAAGNLVAAVNNKGMCYVWNMRDGTQQTSRLVPLMKLSAHKNYALKCKFSPDSTILATTSADQTAKIWSVEDFSLQKTLTDPSQRWVWDLAFTSDSRYLFTGSSDNFARLWDLESGTVQREYAGHQKAVISIAFRDTVIG